MEQTIQQIIKVAIEASIPIIIAGTGWLIKVLVDFVAAKIKESRTKLDDYLAGLAVKWAEDKFGPGKGAEKLDSAALWLATATKGRITISQAEDMVRAAYQSLFGAMAQLKNG